MGNGAQGPVEARMHRRATITSLGENVPIGYKKGPVCGHTVLVCRLGGIPIHEPGTHKSNLFVLGLHAQGNNRVHKGRRD